jgi:hypothetical protein
MRNFRQEKEIRKKKKKTQLPCLPEWTYNNNNNNNNNYTLGVT